MSTAKRKQKPQPVGAKALVGSDEARRAASVVLESVCGLCSVEEASGRLGVAVPRYYVLETRALQGLISSLEPRPRGRQQSVTSRVDELQREAARLQKELRRYQALHRAATRAMGIAPLRDKAPEAKGGKQRRMRRRARAERVIEILRGEGSSAVGATSPPEPAEAVS